MAIRTVAGSRTPGFFQAKKKLPTRAVFNRTRRTPSELKGSSAEADGSTLGAVAPREAESAREVSLAQGGVRWASLQEGGGAGILMEEEGGGRRGRRRDDPTPGLRFRGERERKLV